MKWTYDPQADAIYVTLLRGYIGVTAVSLAGCEVVLDVDPVAGCLVGVEIIGVERVFPRLRELLADPPEMLGDAASG